MALWREKKNALYNFYSRNSVADEKRGEKELRLERVCDERTRKKEDMDVEGGEERGNERRRRDEGVKQVARRRRRRREAFEQITR